MKYVIIIGAGLGAVMLFLLATAGANTELFERHYQLLVALNAGFVLFLMAVVGYLLWRLKRRLSAGVFGTRLALRLLLVASGFLHGQAGQPERSWSHLDADYLQHVFLVNTLGPALLIKHLFPLLPKRGPCVAAFVSARVGSIADNALGGWYGYRASKAALNQLVKTASIELTRRNPDSVCVALHPGTVDTALSQPFAKTGLKVRPPEQAAGELLGVIAGLRPASTGALIDYQGQTLPF